MKYKCCSLKLLYVDHLTSVEQTKHGGLPGPGTLYGSSTTNENVKIFELFIRVMMSEHLTMNSMCA